MKVDFEKTVDVTVRVGSGADGDLSLVGDVDVEIRIGVGVRGEIGSEVRPRRSVDVPGVIVLTIENTS